MNCLVWQTAVGLLLAAQAAVGLLPQVPWPCLTCQQRCPCLPAKDTCCADCRGAVPTAPIECGCQSDRAPTALVSVKATVPGLPDPVTTAAVLVGPQGSGAAARWHSIDARRGDVPDIPVRILFCTWLE